jgi:hypothetical protein
MYQQLLQRIAEVLTHERIGYAVFSPPAGMVSGEPGRTNGVHILVGTNLERARDVLDAVQTMRLTPLIEPYHFGRRTFVVPCIDPESGFRFDFAVARSPHEREALTRARSVDLGGGLVHFATLEDLVVHHISAGTSTDLEAAGHLLRTHASLDRAYIRAWLTRVGSSTGSRLVDRFTAMVGNTS